VLEALQAADVDNRVQSAVMTIRQALIEIELTAVVNSASTRTWYSASVATESD
jgi:hypothetical protein